MKRILFSFLIMCCSLQAEIESLWSQRDLSDAKTRVAQVNELYELLASMRKYKALIVERVDATGTKGTVWKVGEADILKQAQQAYTELALQHMRFMIECAELDYTPIYLSGPEKRTTDYNACVEATKVGCKMKLIKDLADPIMNTPQPWFYDYK